MKSRSTSRGAKQARLADRRLITIDDLTRLVGVSDPQIAPDGSAIVFVRKHVGDKNQYVTNLWLVPTVGGDPRQLTWGNKDRQPRLSADGTKIAFVGEREKGRPQLYVLDRAGGEARPVTRFPEGSFGALAWSPDGRWLAVAFRERDPDWTEAAKKSRTDSGASDPPRVIDDPWYRLDGDGYFNATRHVLHVVDSTTGEIQHTWREDRLGTFSFDFSPDSTRLVIAANRHKQALLQPEHDELLLLALDSGKVRPIPNLPPGPKGTPVWSPDGRHIAYAGRLGPDGFYSVENLELWVCEPETGNPRSLTAATDECLMAVCLADSVEAAFAPKFVWTADSRRLLVKIGRHGRSQIASVTLSGKFQFLTTAAAEHDLGNLARKGGLAAMCFGDATHPSEIAVGRSEGDHLSIEVLTAFNQPLLDELELATPSEHWVETADGTQVHAWLLLPPTSKRRAKMPGVLEIHGGPHAQYGSGFFHEFQLLAAQGYVVCYSNPRGSKGYGRDHTAAIRGAWGSADWVDIQAVTRFLKSQPMVDPKRLGVMGGSYGGYMTNWVIGHTREFAGAITDRCVSNLVSMFGSSDLPDEPDSYFPGNSWDRPEALWSMSPLKYLGEARTPTLIIHSEGDLRCNVEQAEQVYTVLHLNQVPVRFVRYPRESSHGLSRSGPPDLRRHRLGQILDWWTRWLK